MDLASRPRRGERVLARQASGSLVLLDPDSGKYFTLDEIGARIWELSDGSRSVSEIAEAVCAEYDAPRETVEADAVELLGDLAGEQLVVDEGARS
ncbi:MAG: PqqD family protein [Candidatus Limnocylindria bacterium]